MRGCEFHIMSGDLTSVIACTYQPLRLPASDPSNLRSRRSDTTQHNPPPANGTSDAHRICLYTALDAAGELDAWWHLEDNDHEIEQMLSKDGDFVGMWE
jgi:hypothetical protein